jgi:hypothetical protein
MDFKITTLYYPSGWVAVAQKGLITFVSEYYEDDIDAREDVGQQIHQHYINVHNSVHNVEDVHNTEEPRYNILDWDENIVRGNLTMTEVDAWLLDRNNSLYLLEKI